VTHQTRNGVHQKAGERITDIQFYNKMSTSSETEYTQKICQLLYIGIKRCLLLRGKNLEFQLFENEVLRKILGSTMDEDRSSSGH
jgi:hypothetical protein